jgi:prenyl protein peptidase
MQFYLLECTRPLSVSRSLIYCSVISISFVGSLYVFVPSCIRALDRNAPAQIKWRTLATMSVCSGSVAALDFTCDPNNKTNNFRETASAVLTVISHVALLYLGPLMKQAYQTFLCCQDNLTFTRFVQTYYQLYWSDFVESFMFNSSETKRLTYLRNLLIAPITEEIVFRKCIVTALDAAGLTTATVVLVAPLFFAFAHAHHAFVKLQQGESRASVLLQTAFQTTYTTLFGSYASFVYLKQRSVVAVTLCHSFCNAMGLPDLAFTRPSSTLYKRRASLLTAHVVGLVGFVGMLPILFFKAKMYSDK